MLVDRISRLVDGAVALTGLILLSPLLFVVALWVRLDSPGPIIHRATRVGKDGQIFKLYKFRSMVAGAATRGPGITAAGDARITRAGRLLRRTKLDELPQLANVIRGEMSLVGPRPEDPRFVMHYSPEQRKILAVRPGITSAASLHYRHEEHLLAGDDWETVYRQHILPHKLAIDLAYLQQRTLISDFLLILRTLATLFARS